MKSVKTRGKRITERQKATLFKCFCLDMVQYSKSRASAAGMAKVDKNTAALWYRTWRESIYTASRRAPRFFGEVEMDQKSFGGRGRKKMQAHLKQLAKKLPHAEFMEKAKAIRSEHKTQVFGILQRGGNVYLHIIKKADKKTLMPIIRLVVEEGSTVFTDSWRGFSELGLDGYTHRSVNHSIEYMDRKGSHINGIESFWSYAQRRLAQFNGIPAATLPLHLKECESRFNHRQDFAKALKAIL